MILIQLGISAGARYRQLLREVVDYLPQEGEMAFAWRIRFSSLGDWQWTCGPLPNGWTARVADESQIFRPPRPTEYLVSSITDDRMVESPERYSALASAKRAALALAMAQPDVAGKPAEASPSRRQGG